MDGTRTRRSGGWLRWAFVIGAASTGAAFVACGGDDNANAPLTQDASTDNGSSGTSSGSSGTSSGADGNASSSGSDGATNDANDGQAAGIVTVTNQVGIQGRQLAVDGTNVYWTDEIASDAGGNVGRVMKIAVGGGTPTEIARYPADQSTGWIGVDATSIYWAVKGTTIADRGIWKAPIAGGAPVQIYSPGNYVNGTTCDPLQVTLGTANLAFKLDGPSIVGAVPIGGGPTTDLTPDIAKGMIYAQGIGADSTYAYFQSGGSSFTDGVIRKSPFGSDAWPTDIVKPDDGGIAQYVSGFGDLVVSGGNLYWGNNQNETLFKVAVNGGTPTAIATGPKAGNIAHLAVDGTNAYWIPSPFNPSIVMKVSVNGGAASTLATGSSTETYASPIAVDATSVYWFSPPHLYKTAK